MTKKSSEKVLSWGDFDQLTSVIPACGDIVTGGYFTFKRVAGNLLNASFQFRAH